MQQYVFRRFSHKTAEIVGKPWGVALTVAIVAGGAFTGPLFGYSNTWQLVINAGTTIVTVVFLTQNSQKRGVTYRLEGNDHRSLHPPRGVLLSTPPARRRSWFRRPARPP